MSELTFDQRMNILEALIVGTAEDANKLRTEDELDEVVTQVFDELKDLQNRIDALSNTLNMIDTILDTTNGQ